jgi:hypothetical protein
MMNKGEDKWENLRRYGGAAARRYYNSYKEVHTNSPLSISPCSSRPAFNTMSANCVTVLRYRSRKAWDDEYKSEAPPHLIYSNDLWCRTRCPNQELKFDRILGGVNTESNTYAYKLDKIC